ncbi:MAG TPA: tRNA lysidine(34) synthetase TilS [Acidobacteriota bacterium]
MMRAFIEEVAESAARDGLFTGIDRLLVGCSAGGDSTALLDVLVRLAPDLGVTLAVAHLHHGWRGAEADADLEAARRLAERYGLPFFAERAAPTATSGSREEVARSLRLAFFERQVAAWPADAVALGHTADDQVETMILNLARGTGRRGLGGMRPRAVVGGLLIVRPLLERRRAELRDYARSRGLGWRQDSSNRDISLARNRLRRRLLGELRQINPGAAANAARAARLLRDEEEWLDEIAARALAGVRCEEEFPGGLCLRADGLAELPRPLQRRVVQRAIEEVRGHRRGIALEHVEWVVAGLEGTSAVARDLPGVRVRWEKGGTRLRFLPLSGRTLARPARAE